MPKKLERIFEKEYEAKGKTKKEADLIFFKWEAKHGIRHHRFKSK